MPIRVRCSGCQKTLKVPEKFAGKRVRCPVCQTSVQVPGDPFDPSETATNALAATSAIPALPNSSDGEGDAEEEGTYRLTADPEPSPHEPPSLERGLPPRVVGKNVRARAEQRDRGFDDLDSARPARRMGSALTNDATEGGWRDHLVWILLVALAPLAFSIVIPERPAGERFVETIRLHPEVADSLDPTDPLTSLVESIPEHRLVGAHLPYDTHLHWAYALIAAAVFLGVLSVMSVGGEAGPMRLVWTGVLTGTVGIFLLLGFQFVAAATTGIGIRGRGILIVVFLIVKLIGFSYQAAMNPENGFLLSFLGFTAGVGFCEELCKAIPVMVYLRGSSNAGWRAACLVGMASGIGFGISEGITYSSDFYNGVAPFSTYLLRFASCVALHAIWAAAVAILMRENQDYLFHDGLDWGDAGSFILHYLLIAMVLHGLYDTLLKRDYELAALAIAVGSFAWLGWLVSSRRREEAD